MKACGTTSWHLWLDRYAFLGTTLKYYLGYANTIPWNAVLMSRDFWPGASKATTYSPPNPLTADKNGIITTLVPGTVTGVTASTMSSHSIAVGFIPLTPAGGALPVTYNALCSNAQGSYAATSAFSPLTVSGLTPNTSYSCTVAAVSAAGSGASSTSASAITADTNTPPAGMGSWPGPPTNVTALLTNGVVQMNYSAPITNAGSAITGYFGTCVTPDGYQLCGIQQGVTATTHSISIACPNSATAPQMICSVVAGNNFYANSTYNTCTNCYAPYTYQYGSPAALVIGLPLAPNTPRWSTTPGMINVSYSAPSIASASPITGYTASCTATGYPTCTGAVSGSTYTIGVPNCDAGVAYQCSVAAENASGTGTQSMLTTVTAPAAIAPDTPTITSLTGTDVSITANFTESNNGGSPITGYTLTCSNTGNGSLCKALHSDPYV